MRDIDEMDMLGYLEIRAWNSSRAQAKAESGKRYIDEVWPGLKP